jgi:hypothetical protein
MLIFLKTCALFYGMDGVSVKGGYIHVATMDWALLLGSIITRIRTKKCSQ